MEDNEGKKHETHHDRHEEHKSHEEHEHKSHEHHHEIKDHTHEKHDAEHHARHTHHKKRSSSQWIYYALAVVIIIIVGASIFYFMHGSDDGCEGDVCKVEVPGGPSEEGLVAEFDGGNISADQLDQYYDMFFFLRGLPESYRSMVSKGAILNQTIIEEILYNKALDEGYSEDRSDVEEKIGNTIESQGMGLDDFKAKFENQSFDYNFFIDYQIKNMVISKMLNATILSKISVSDDELQDYYNSNTDEFNISEQIKASHILVNTSEEAEEIIGLLDDGADFAELAKNHSIGPTGPTGGDLGFFGKAMMVKEFEDAAFGLENIGDYTHEPVKTQFGYHVIKLTGRQEARQQTFDEAKSQIKESLLKAKQSAALKEYIDNLRKESSIKIYLKEDNQQPPTNNKAAVPVSDKPEVELFVMSYCPYGTQIEKGILPVLNLLGDKIDFQLKFVNYAMHGEKEVYENTRQYCIQKEQSTKFNKYLSCFLKGSDAEGCLSDEGIDIEKMDACMNKTDTEFKINYNLKNKQGQFPRYLVDDSENKKYGVQGSPTLIINGVQVSSGRDSASLLNTICASFSSQPEECTQQLSSEQPSAGFGYSASGTSTSGGCGV